MKITKDQLADTRSQSGRSTGRLLMGIRTTILMLDSGPIPEPLLCYPRSSSKALQWSAPIERALIQEKERKMCSIHFWHGVDWCKEHPYLWHVIVHKFWVDGRHLSAPLKDKTVFLTPQAKFVFYSLLACQTRNIAESQNCLFATIPGQSSFSFVSTS